MFEGIREFLFGKEETVECKCGGTMKRTDSGIMQGSYRPHFECEDCGSQTDGSVFRPSERFKRMEA